MSWWPVYTMATASVRQNGELPNPIERHEDRSSPGPQPLKLRRAGRAQSRAAKISPLASFGLGANRYIPRCCTSSDGSPVQFSTLAREMRGGLLTPFFKRHASRINPGAPRLPLRGAGHVQPLRPGQRLGPNSRTDWARRDACCIVVRACRREQCKAAQSVR